MPLLEPTTPNVNYNFSELQSGTGYTTYYHGKMGTSYILGDMVFYSDANWTSFDCSSVGNTKFDIDFDVLMNRATTVRGALIVDIPIYILNSDLTLHVHAYLRKWDGVTETEIVNGVSASFAYGGLMEQRQHVHAIMLTIPTTTFKKGEYIRITVVGDITARNGGITGYVWHDPTDTAFSPDMGTYLIPTSSISIIPIKVDV